MLLGVKMLLPSGERLLAPEIPGGREEDALVLGEGSDSAGN